MSTWHLIFLALACAPVALGCTVRTSQRSHDTGLVPGDAGPPPHADASHPQPDAFVVSWADSGRAPDAAHHDASAAPVDAGHADAATIDAALPRLDVGVTDAQMVTGATRCWEGETVMASGVFVGTTCGAIDLVGSSCGRAGAPERYFTALGPMAGGHPSYAVQVDPPDFVIQELTPTEVGFDCAPIDGACSTGSRVLTGSDITQFYVERGTGGCGDFTLTVSAM